MREIYMGMDLCRKNLQISYFREDKGEPESIYQLNNTETYQLPNVMFFSTDENKWYVGNNVSSVRFQKNGKIIEDVVGNVGSDNQVVLNGETYSYDKLLLILLKKQIEDFLSRVEEAVIKRLTVTIEVYDKAVFDVLRKLREELGLSEEEFHIMSHENAFFQYVMNQDEQIRNNSVVMFEYGTDGMYYYRIDKRYHGKSTIYNIIHEKLDNITYQMLFDNVSELDELFAQIAKKKMKETYISAVYLTGSGFHDNWIDKSKNVVCDGRRVFMGQNIYTTGACYHARFGAYEMARDQVLCAEGCIPYDIGVQIGDTDGRSRFYPIAVGGREWYNMKGKVTLFLDETNRIDMVYRNRISKDTQKDIIEIHGLPKRPPKTTKISLEVELNDNNTGAIIIRDEGFGKIYPTTNKIYRREISWQDQ